MTIIEKFKENKKEMEIKIEQAHKLADAAVDEFVSSIKPLVKDASDEDMNQFINDDELEHEDKLALIVAYAETHDDVGGIAIIGLRK